ncbi:MAG: heme exporter protein CcmB [Actinomycetota bacterium]|nr:heme exporter protein CcmB [Actinomycetota bacterium]
MSGVGFVAKTAALTRKDLRVEARSRDTLPPMLAFAFTVALVLAFTLPDATRASAKVVAGFLWITVLFAGLIGFARTFEVEREEGALDALLLVPLDRSGIFFSKAAANLVLLALVEVFLVPVFGLFFSLDLSSWLMLALVIVLVDIGFVAVGTLFASLASQTRSRELILPILALPVLVPAFIAGVELSADLFAGAGLDDIAARGWFGILLFFDAVFLVVGALGFEFAID